MSAAPESQPCRIFIGEQAEQELSRMGLRERYFHNAITVGNERRERCGPTHPRPYQGYVMWAETLAHFRMECLALAQDWKMGHADNYETIFNLSRKLAIAVVGGDTNTGIQGFDDPMTARPRGPITQLRVKRNYRGQAMLPGMPKSSAENSEDDCETWFFLVNGRENRLYSELALPILMGKSQRVSRYAKRILFDPIELGDVAVTPVEPDEGPEDETTVHVGRK
ncbi:hypothetical protein [Actinomadura decatromicini]|uniref:Uncharacterized protein n=1 Tax=Actinomadura decatromicini TaxID=2604572 RepID=A0A5D3FQF9_9ACTN|nr:hypothetical protein [Actinomadura decatromicini]TYK50591.1 hypothetical protein FXF68_08760 [Actinomadura decatromicini]